jgi:dimethylargininase
MMKTGLSADRYMPGTADRNRAAAIVRRISSTYSEALSSGFHDNLEIPDQKITSGAHDEYIAALIKRGVAVTILPALDRFADCCFVEDCAIIVDDRALITNLGHPSRRGEEDAVMQSLVVNGFDTIQMKNGSTLDGGDVLFYDDSFLVGRSRRTNDAGIAELTTIVEMSGRKVVVIDIPPSTLHLVTVCTSPKPGLLIAPEGFLSVSQLESLGEVLWIPKEEAYGANCLAFENGEIIVAAGYPTVVEKLKGVGLSPTTIDMAAFRAADGSLTCLSLFYR